MDKLWLRSYDSTVPATLEYPRMLIHQMFEQAAEKFPEHTALNFFGTTMTYQELRETIKRFAGALQQLGVQPKQRVVLFLPNCPQMIISFYAALSIGTIVVSTNPLYTEKELEYQIIDAGAETLITLDLLFARINNIKTRTPLKRIIVGEIEDYLPPLKKILYPFMGKKGADAPKIEESGEVFRFQNLARSKTEPAPVPDIKPDDTALLQYTGGTTGTSKGAMLSHRNIVSNNVQMRYWYHMVREGKEIFISVLPFFHSYGLAVAMSLPLSVGAASILIPRYVPKDILKAIEHYKATFFPGIPAIYASLNAYKDVRKYDISSVTYCISGSAPLPVNVLNAFEKLTGGTIIEGYGLTEASPVTHCNPIEHQRKIGSIGLPIPDTDCKIVDLETGQELPPGSEGELCIRGPQIMQGYWQKPEETAQVIKDGWLFTGDIARMDDEGYFYIVERKKDMIISEGYNVYPIELDAFLASHTKVSDAAVVGIPDELRGEKVIAYIVLNEGETATQEEIIKYCRDNLAKYKIPKRVIFTGQLPKSLVGKVLRRVLREEALRQADRE
jgi:long-chain acyl-CoA synthetase